MTEDFLKQAEEGDRTAILKQQMLQEFIFGGDFSITDLSRAMSLSVPTVTRLIGEMIDMGFVYDFGKQGTNGGRKPSIYGLNPYAGYYVGVDISRDSMLLAITNFKGQVVASKWDSQPLIDTSPESIDRFCRTLENFVDQQHIERDKILAYGVNVSGRVNSNTGYSYSYYFAEEQPLAKLLEERLGCNVFIENDTRSATYGEYMSGVGANEKNMLYINASWGLGLGMILDGKLFYGKSGFSGEYGHFPMLENDIICRCGKRGCLETGASGSAVHRIFLEKLREKRNSSLTEKFDAGEEITLEDILAALKREDVLAIEVIEGVGQTLGKAIAGLINIFNPELIVLGGSLAAAKDYLMLPVKSAINKYSLHMVSKDTSVKLSRLGDEAGAIGACLLARSTSLGLIER